MLLLLCFLRLGSIEAVNRSLCADEQQEEGGRGDGPTTVVDLDRWRSNNAASASSGGTIGPSFLMMRMRYNRRVALVGV